MTLVGLVARIVLNGYSLGGDELSTVWIVRDQSLGHVLSEVRSDAEITPPLYFVLAWLASKFGSSPDLVRLPSMIAGTATIPVVFLLGRRMLGNPAGVIAAAVTAASPFMVYFSANARGYAVMLLLLVCSTLFLLVAAEEKRSRWWVLYAVAACLAMYAHYTALFVLFGQFAWALWFFPEARRPMLIATAAAAAGFLPWLPGYLADANSPTTPILEALQTLQQGGGIRGKLVAVEQLLFWRIAPGAWTSGGRLDVVLIIVGSAGLLVAAAAMAWRRRAAEAAGSASDWAQSHRNAILIVILMVATPIGALLLSLVSTDIFGGRNLAASWTGIPLAIGGLAVAAGPVLGLVGVTIALTGFGLGTVNLIDSDKTEFQFRDAADYIDSVAGPDDSIVDAALLTPVPLTSFDVYLDSGRRQFRLGLSTSDPPFLPGTVEIAEPQDEIKRAFESGDRVFVTTLGGEDQILDTNTLTLNGEVLKIPKGWTAVDQEVFPGFFPIAVTTFEMTGNAGPGKEEPRGE